MHESDTPAARRTVSAWRAITADGIWETDAELRITYVSSSLARAMGLDIGQILGLMPDQAYRLRFPDATNLSSFMRPLRNRQPFDSQFIRAIDRLGSRSCFLNQGRPIYNGKGEFAGYRGVAQGVTEHWLTKKELRENEMLLRLTTDNVPALISYIDSERCFLFCNKVHEIWLGRPLNEITGQRVADLYDAQTFLLIEPHLDLAFSGEHVSFEFETQARHLRGTYIPDVDDGGNVRGICGLMHDITDLKRVENELRVLTQIDALTGLANRRRYEERLADAIARSERSGHPMALMFVDLDNFKAINDRCGHKGGDLVLQEFSRRLTQCLRQTDTVARLAGDEFVIVLESLHSPEDTAIVAQKILDAIAPAFAVEGEGPQVFASIGIAVRRRGEIDGEVLLQRADAALYSAKADGRGLFRVAA